MAVVPIQTHKLRCPTTQYNPSLAHPSETLTNCLATCGHGIPSHRLLIGLTGSHQTYNVGPGQTYTELTDVPWLSLQSG